MGGCAMRLAGRRATLLQKLTRQPLDAGQVLAHQPMKVPALATVATLVVLAAAALGAQDPDRDGGRVVVDMYCAGSWERLDPTDPAVARQLDELMSLAAWEYLAQTNGTAVPESLEIPCDEDFATQPGFACIRVSPQGRSWVFLLSWCCAGWLFHRAGAATGRNRAACGVTPAAPTLAHRRTPRGGRGRTTACPSWLPAPGARRTCGWRRWCTCRPRRSLPRWLTCTTSTH